MYKIMGSLLCDNYNFVYNSHLYFLFPKFEIVNISEKDDYSGISYNCVNSSESSLHLHCRSFEYVQRALVNTFYFECDGFIEAELQYVIFFGKELCNLYDKLNLSYSLEIQDEEEKVIFDKHSKRENYKANYKELELKSKNRIGSKIFWNWWEKLK